MIQYLSALVLSCFSSQLAAQPHYIAQPLVREIYTADPSAHVWNDGRIYIYSSHDIETDTPEDDLGSHFDMRDYRILSMDRVDGAVTIHGIALDIGDVPWANRQMWAPDAAFKDGTYYLYFPAKDHQGIFRIGVATSKSPTGPFIAESQPIQDSYSIDPAVFRDNDGAHYMYFGGIWGGQLQKWVDGVFDPQGSDTDLNNDAALTPRIARLDDDMLAFAEKPRAVVINDTEGVLLADDHDRRFFEGTWVFKRNNIYYLTYSTGDTHYLVYATGDNPYGPFTYRGRILEPVQGWTTHHSIFEHNGQWYLAFHDTQLSGKTHLRNVKITPLSFTLDGAIQTVHP
ncbi:MAG TPA: glycoside hydrolase family 43 protein [Chlamydiales bacterium]|nr:glycoside hydrolase family 43 protein [Chlamydiales bacterium]